MFITSIDFSQRMLYDAVVRLDYREVVLAALHDGHVQHNVYSVIGTRPYIYYL